MKISKYDNSLMTEQKQSVIVGANTIRSDHQGKKNKKHQKQCHFCYFCNLMLVYLPTNQLIYLKK